MAEYMDLKPRTIKQRLKADGGYWIDGEKVGRKEPGYKGEVNLQTVLNCFTICNIFAVIGLFLHDTAHCKIAVIGL